MRRAYRMFVLVLLLWMVAGRANRVSLSCTRLLLWLHHSWSLQVVRRASHLKHMNKRPIRPVSLHICIDSCADLIERFRGHFRLLVVSAGRWTRLQGKLNYCASQRCKRFVAFCSSDLESSGRIRSSSLPLGFAKRDVADCFIGGFSKLR